MKPGLAPPDDVTPPRGEGGTRWEVTKSVPRLQYSSPGALRGRDPRGFGPSRLCGPRSPRRAAVTLADRAGPAIMMDMRDQREGYVRHYP